MTLEEKGRRDGRFFAFMIPAFFLWLIGQYTFPLFPTDQLNVIIPYFAQNHGWTPTDVTDPASIGRFVLIPLTIVLGNIIIKMGAKRAFCIFIFLFGASEILIALDGSLSMVSIAMFLFPILGVGMTMATFSLIRNWFRDWRGTALGIVTLVSPLSNATSIAYLTAGTSPGGIGFTPTFLILALIVCAAGVVGMAIIRETPESVGCFPDGARTAPPPEELADASLVGRIKMQHVFRHKESWFHLVVFGILLSSLTVYPAFFVTRFEQLGFTTAQMTAFTFGFSILGGILSLISGIIDDRLGTKNASILLCSLFFLGTIGLRFGAPDRAWMIWIGIVALGGVIGAAPNLNPSMLLHTFGRKSFDHAFKWTYTVLNIFPAAGLYVTSFVLTKTGSLNPMYTAMIPVGALALILLILIRNKVDLTADVLADQAGKEAGSAQPPTEP
ncbi:MAG: MFS transporter [Clostridiales Family XIII bacterium]|jgi:MFS family permease|nr:MFS transporter [Clostridiales Family XIII bacterium]